MRGVTGAASGGALTGETFCEDYADHPLSSLVSAMAQRVTIRKRTPYNTTSNRRRVVKTPGGKLVYHHLKKLPTSPKCGDCGIALPGVRSCNVPHEKNCRYLRVAV